jgi:CheY-like chemotaxis protein
MILVVDDAEQARALIRAAVEPLGQPILEAADGQQALELYDRHPASLVITDDRMPTMSGADLIQQLRQRHPTLGIILVTAYDSPVRPLDWAGCNAILHKPFDTGALLALAETLLVSPPVPKVHPRRERRGTCELAPPG